VREEKDMAQSLYELLHACTVRITVPKVSQGTGFFVAPGGILTCAHVVQSALKSNTPIEVSWNNQTTIAQIQGLRGVSSSDLALLRVNLSNHPCILLHDGVEPFGELYSYGYSGDESEGASTTFSCEGWAGERQELLKFKLGRARPGMSGSPLLSVDSGCVCGMVQSTFDRNIDLGGKALLSKVIFREFPELEFLQKQFHQQDRRWWNLLTHQQRLATGLQLSMPGGLGMLVEAQNTRTIKLAISCSSSPKDKSLKEMLIAHLSLMERHGFIKIWEDQQIVAGSLRDEEIIKHFNEADIILCLISPDFINSNHCYEFEMRYALERRKMGKVEVIPVLLRSVDCGLAPFQDLQIIPRNTNKSIADRANKDKAFTEVAREIDKTVKALLASKS
jgi:hypothetical protein